MDVDDSHTIRGVVVLSITMSYVAINLGDEATATVLHPFEHCARTEMRDRIRAEATVDVLMP